MFLYGNSGRNLAMLGLALMFTACQQTTMPIVKPVHFAYNQQGFAANGPKTMVISGHIPARSAFSVVNVAQHKDVFQGKLTAAKNWFPAQQQAAVADFSELWTPGEYQLRLANGAVSDHFLISNDNYQRVLISALKAFFFNRASTDLSPAYAGRWARRGGHSDQHVYIHYSAASQQRPSGYVIAAPGGWYDAGDYNKYVVTGAVSSYSLLAAYQAFPDFLAQRSSLSPTSAAAVPDILTEAKWELDWLLTMQDPHDGGVYHKLTHKKFAPIIMPVMDDAPRYVVQKSTAASLDLAAVMAQASRVFSHYETVFPGLSARYANAAETAWQWAQAHPADYYQQPVDIHTGSYEDKHLDDEWLWAASELYLTQHKQQYLDVIERIHAPFVTPSWQQTAALGYMSLLTAADPLVPETLLLRVRGQLRAWANKQALFAEQSGYAVPMASEDFVWGSNGVAMNKAMALLVAGKVFNTVRYQQAARDLFDYVLGRNPLAMSFVTGIGQHSPLHIHHRISMADAINDPVPGWLVGGPQPGHQDHCAYASAVPALSYIDDECSYATNEVAINWNAPLVYVAAAMAQAQQRSIAPVAATPKAQ